jgi:hypothetical protein
LSNAIVDGYFNGIQGGVGETPTAEVLPLHPVLHPSEQRYS